MRTARRRRVAVVEAWMVMSAASKPLATAGERDAYRAKATRADGEACCLISVISGLRCVISGLRPSMGWRSSCHCDERGQLER